MGARVVPFVVRAFVIGVNALDKVYDSRVFVIAADGPRSLKSSAGRTALACVQCGSVNVYGVGGRSARARLLECRDCRKPFPVTVESVMEDSHVPLSTWTKAFHLICSSKKGMSALQLQRNLGIGRYRSAWFLAHRIREAMRCEPVASMLAGARAREGQAAHVPLASRLAPTTAYHREPVAPPRELPDCQWRTISLPSPPDRHILRVHGQG